jgi:hypothetical protein
MAPIKRQRTRSLVSRATEYAADDTASESLEIPEDLTTLSDDDLAALSTQAGEAFDALYGDGTADFTPEETATLASLTDAIEALAADQERRDNEASARRSEVEALAARRQAALGADADAGAGGDADEEDADDDAEDDDAADDTDDTDDEDGTDAGAADTVTAAAATKRRGPVSINLGAARRNAPKQKQAKPKADAAPSMKDFAFSNASELGVDAGQGIDYADAGKMLAKRLSTFPATQYASAQARGQHMREQHSLLTLKRQIPKEFMVASANSVEDAQTAIKNAIDMKRLPGGTLTAAGWCAPSEPMYDICTTASRDGLWSIPEVGISRGGLLLPTTPSFQELYDAIGFHFTEADAIAGNYAPGAAPAARANATAYDVGDVVLLNGAILEATVAGNSGAQPPTSIPPVGQTFTDGGVTWVRISRVANVAGSKPCYEMDCPTWEDYRLEGDGLCLTADLIQQRGYPEGLEWATENALIAHDHKVSAGRLAKAIEGSTYRQMTTGTVGATAPLLAAIELRAEAIRYAGRLSRNTLLEGVFPFWVRGVIRQDLSVRLGIDLLEVSNERIDGWFRQRGIVPQYVYDWQALPVGATTWPETIDFLMYEAAAWIGGVDDIITLNTVYDSQQLGQNKFTALFTEEAWLVAPRCGNSEVVRVPLCADGSVAAGVLLDCDLTPSA